MIPLIEDLSQVVENGTTQFDDNMAVQNLLSKTLIEPLSEFMSRPRKSCRRELISLGFLLAKESLDSVQGTDHEPIGLFEQFNAIVELIHSGSLIVDDIQDQSHFRRGKETLHRIHGVPLALNAGNWLYFWPFHLIHNLKLTESVRMQVLAACHETLLLAHAGQALDIGTPLKQMSPSEVSSVVLKTIELKSGALTALAMNLGALAYLNSCSSEIDEDDRRKVLKCIHQFGLKFGQLLQMCDDIGNLKSEKNIEKRFEDLRLLRPSFIWLILAEQSELRDYEQALAIAGDKFDLEKLQELFENIKLEKRAREKVKDLAEEWLNELFSSLPKISIELKNKIITSTERLYHAY